MLEKRDGNEDNAAAERPAKPGRFQPLAIRRTSGAPACRVIAQNKLDGITKGISPLELRRRVEQGDRDIVLVDVRTPAERQEVRLPFEDRTVHIPLGALRERLGELPREKQIVPFCKVSLRGYEAERILYRRRLSERVLPRRRDCGLAL